MELTAIPGLLEPGLFGEAIQSQAYATLAGDPASGVLVLCDHASNALPAEYGDLGLDSASLTRHIAWDIGAAGVASRLAAALKAPAVFTRYSRLLIDCNRAADDPTLIMRLSDGAVIPGNRILSAQEREARIASFYEPYHAEVTRLIDAALGAGKPPLLVSIHTYTDIWKGIPRPWHCGVLWDKDERLAGALLNGLKLDRSLVVGDNEPYSGRLYGDTLWRHGTSRGLPHAIVEIRQDLVSTSDGEAQWAQRLSRILEPVLAEAGLNRIEHFGSHTS